MPPELLITVCSSTNKSNSKVVVRVAKVVVLYLSTYQRESPGTPCWVSMLTDWSLLDSLDWSHWKQKSVNQVSPVKTPLMNLELKTLSSEIGHLLYSDWSLAVAAHTYVQDPSDLQNSIDYRLTSFCLTSLICCSVVVAG